MQRPSPPRRCGLSKGRRSEVLSVGQRALAAGQRESLAGAGGHDWSSSPAGVCRIVLRRSLVAKSGTDHRSDRAELGRTIRSSAWRSAISLSSVCALTVGLGGRTLATHAIGKQAVRLVRRASAAARQADRSTRRPTRFAAFISYSHAGDRALASSLQAGLHRFARPWHRLRAVRVFRDDASLSANPNLWASISEALLASEFLILIASPEAKESPWVKRELELWAAEKPRDKVLIAISAGTVRWDGAAADFDWTHTSALPRAVSGLLDDEPRIVDLSWARVAREQELGSERFREALADLAAPLHGRPKDELLGEDVRQHRRTIRLARAAVALLTALLLAAVAAAIVALVQRNRAEREADRAQQQARVALGREIAMTAISQLPVDRQRSLLLGVKAAGNAPTQAAVALRQGLFTQKPIRALPSHRGAIDAAVFSPDGSRAATLGSDGAVRVSDPRSGRLIRRFHARDGVAAAAFSPDRRWLATQSQGGVAEIWPLRPRHPRPRTIDTAPGALVGPGSVAFAPDSRSILTASEFGVTMSRLSGPSIREIRPPSSGYLLSATFSRDGRRILSASTSQLVLWHVQTGRVIRVVEAPERIATASLDATGTRLVAVTEDEGVSVWHPRADRPESLLPGHQNGRVSGALSADGELLVTTDVSSVRIWQLSTGQPVAVLTEEPTFPTVATFDPDGKRVLIADLDGRARIYSCRLCNAPLRQLVAEARREIDRPLTPDERVKYLHLDG